MLYLVRQQYPGRVRKALDRLFVELPKGLIRFIRPTVGDDTIKPAQIKGALKRLRSQASGIEIPSTPEIKAETKVIRFAVPNEMFPESPLPPLLYRPGT